MTRIVLDASALLAAIYQENGKERAIEHLPHAVISSINMAEVASRMMRDDTTIAGIKTALRSIEIPIVAFDEEQAFLAAELLPLTRSQGLSLGDRACLALAMQKNLPVLTADRAWKNLKLPVTIEVVR